VAVHVPDLAVIIVRLIDEFFEGAVIGVVVFVDAAEDFFRGEDAVINRDAGAHQAADQADTGIRARRGGDFAVRPWFVEEFGVDVGDGAVHIYIGAREGGAEKHPAVAGHPGEQIVDMLVLGLFEIGEFAGISEVRRVVMAAVGRIENQRQGLFRAGNAERFAHYLSVTYRYPVVITGRNAVIKGMHDIKYIRENPEKFDKAMARRKLPKQTPDILKLDEERRKVQTELQKLQSERNEKSQKIGEIKKAKGDAQDLMDEVAGLKERMGDLTLEEQQIAEELNELLSTLPNILADDVPDGADEKSNVEVRKQGEPKRVNDVKDHADIGEKLGMMDFETAAKLSGSRFVILEKGLARLERALAQFFLDTHTQEHGYTEVSAPLLVNDKTMYGTGQLPKFADDQFQTTRGDWLIPTSEVSMTNIVAEMIVDDETLPRRYTAFTPCFRQEAGAAGKDTRGMIRMHQFYKVELVSVTKPEDSEAEHERMTECAE
jgi:seryl-tRNA synthetase